MTEKAFTYSDYHHFLNAVSEGGYKCSSFQNDTGKEDIILLRHDVDKSVKGAYEIAELEAENGVYSTFFFLLRSPMYSLLDPEVQQRITKISQMGHQIGLHCDLRRTEKQLSSDASLDETVIRERNIMYEILPCSVSSVVSFHNPPDKVIGRVPETNHYLSTYDSKYMAPETKYISESDASWYEGNPINQISTREWNRLQVLTHPVWWTNDKKKDPIEILREIKGDLQKKINQYMIESNDLWANFKKN